MRTSMKLLMIVAALVLSAAPALAIASQPNEHSQGNGPPSETPAANHGGPQYGTPSPGPGAGLPEKAKAYGRYCQGESKKHVKGEKGTPFSQCVTAMAKLASGATTSPAKACAGMSKKHVKGEKGTAYSRCVKGAAKLLA